jgi:phospho-N-acetylmuramoyl-pentapeptide-transferase
MNLVYAETVKMLVYGVLSFLIAYWWAPFLIRLLTWLRFWKKKTRTTDSDGNELTVTKQFYTDNEINKLVPRAGGLLIWVTTVCIALFFWFFLKIEGGNRTFQFLNFIDRKSTWIPIGTLVFSAILGFIDDTMVTMESGGNYHAGGLKLRQRLFIIAGMASIVGVWFHFKLIDDSGKNFLHKVLLPFWDGSNQSWYRFDLTNISPSFNIPLINLFVPAGWALIFFTIIVVLSAWGGSVIDGFDGLYAGCIIPMYLAFAGIAVNDGQYKIATLLVVIIGCTLAYLWFNIAPAKFHMGDTGSTSLLVTIAVVAIILNRVWLLPVAGFMFYVTAGSNIIQLTSKKLFKRKVFYAAPLHHHFEASGLTREQVTIRYWLVSILFAMVAMILGLLIK